MLISVNISWKQRFSKSLPFSESQVDKGAAETGVKGVAGRPLRPRQPHVHASWGPPPGHEKSMAQAGQELADLS